MVIYPLIEYYLIIPKAIEILLLLVVAIKILSLRRYILNQLYATALLFWMMYIIMDSVEWLVGANSGSWFIISNIFRDIQMISVMATSFFIFISTRVILKGEKGIDKKESMFVAIIYLILTIFLLFVDGLQVVEVANPMHILNSSELPPVYPVKLDLIITPMTVILSMFPFLMYFYSVVVILQLAKRNKENQELQKRMYLLTIGILLIPLGMIYFIIFSFWNTGTMIQSFVGHGIWGLVPIFIWYSQQRKSNPNQK